MSYISIRFRIYRVSISCISIRFNSFWGTKSLHHASTLNSYERTMGILHILICFRNRIEHCVWKHFYNPYKFEKDWIHRIFIGWLWAMKDIHSSGEGEGLISLGQLVKAPKFETSGARSSELRVPLTTSSPPMMTLSQCIRAPQDVHISKALSGWAALPWRGPRAAGGQCRLVLSVVQSCVPRESRSCSQVKRRPLVLGFWQWTAHLVAFLSLDVHDVATQPCAPRAARGRRGHPRGHEPTAGGLAGVARAPCAAAPASPGLPRPSQPRNKWSLPVLPLQESWSCAPRI